MSMVRMVSGSSLLLSTCFKWSFFHKGHIFFLIFILLLPIQRRVKLFCRRLLLWDLQLFSSSMQIKITSITIKQNNNNKTNNKIQIRLIIIKLPVYYLNTQMHKAWALVLLEKCACFIRNISASMQRRSN